jgi:probable rRNA maturation factor
MSSVRTSVAGTKPPAWLSKASAFAAASLARLDREDWELSILFCGDAVIRDLNRRYRGKDEATDVLSFAQGEGQAFPGIPDRDFIAGDIAISLDALDRNALAFSVARDDELKRLILHGILHLGGMDHEDHMEGSDDAAGSDMLKLQERLLSEFSEVRII